MTISFSENSEIGTIDLHLKFHDFSSNVLNDFVLEDKTAKNLIIKFNRSSPLNVQNMTKFAVTLFGSRNLEVNMHESSVIFGLNCYISKGFVLPINLYAVVFAFWISDLYLWSNSLIDIPTVLLCLIRRF